MQSAPLIVIKNSQRNAGRLKLSSNFPLWFSNEISGPNLMSLCASWRKKKEKGNSRSAITWPKPSNDK